MRIAISQINPTLGAFEKNAQKIIDEIHRAQQRNCHVVVFPEASLFGYHPFDLLERKKIVDNQLKCLKLIEKNIPNGISALVGVIVHNTAKKGKPYFNSAALIQKGKKTKYFHKQLLPTGDVFDEARFIQSGQIKNNIFKIQNKRVLVTICEDIWAWPDQKNRSSYESNPLLEVKEKIDLVINLSASPYYPGKLQTRKKLVQKVARHFRASTIYTNMVGAQDEIIFDGGSFAVDSKGKTILQSVQFEEDLNVLDLTSGEGGFRKQNLTEIEEIRSALVLGIRDFCQKIGIQKVHLGISGGIDSAVVACLAVDALGPANVRLIAMPSPFNADESLALSHQLAKNLSVRCDVFPIGHIFQTIKNEVDQKFSIHEFSIVHENLQARIRGLLLMAFSNKESSLLLSTGNKSEYATGYSTLYGDMCGGLVPIGDLTKAQVYSLAKLYNLEYEVIPNKILTRAPSAELRPNQKDQDSLPPYEDLDASVDRIVTHSQPAKNNTDKWLVKELIRTEFKRWQAAPILKVSQHSFGRGRRLPIAHRASE